MDRLWTANMSVARQLVCMYGCHMQHGWIDGYYGYITIICGYHGYSTYYYNVFIIQTIFQIPIAILILI